MFSRLFALNVLLMTVLTAHATIYVTEPTTGSTYSGGQAITVSWLDNGEQPLLSDIGACNIALYNGNDVLIQQIQPVDVSTVHSLIFAPDPNAGPDSSNYYVQFTSVNSVAGGPYYQYSPSFSLTSMSGSLSSPVASDTSSISVPSTASTPSASATPTPTGSAASSAASSVASSASAASSAASSLSSAASSVASSISGAASSAVSSASSAVSSAASSVSAVGTSRTSSPSSAASSALSSLSSAASGFSTSRPPSSTGSSTSSSSSSTQSSSAAKAVDVSTSFFALSFAMAGVIAGTAML